MEFKMSKSIFKDTERTSLAREIAERIIGAMSDTETTFEDLAKKLDTSVDELHSMIYGIEKDITASQIIDICNAMNCRLNFSLTPAAKIKKGQMPIPGFLKVIK